MNWEYTAQTDEDKTPVHPGAKTYLTQDGYYVSIKNLPDTLLRVAMHCFEVLTSLEKESLMRMLPDSETGMVGFALDDFLFTWEPGHVHTIFVTDNYGHAVGRISVHG